MKIGISKNQLFYSNFIDGFYIIINLTSKKKKNKKHKRLTCPALHSAWMYLQ